MKGSETLEKWSNCNQEKSEKAVEVSEHYIITDPLEILTSKTESLQTTAVPVCKEIETVTRDLRRFALTNSPVIINKYLVDNSQMYEIRITMMTIKC